MLYKDGQLIKWKSQWKDIKPNYARLWQCTPDMDIVMRDIDVKLKQQYYHNQRGMESAC